MAPDAEDAKFGQTINEITDRATLIVREEIELAKAEVEEKVRSLLKGVVIAGAAGFFVLMGLMLFLEGMAWIFYLNVFTDPFWGFLIVAAVLFLVAGLAGWIAARAFRAGSPPAPQMAIAEAQLTRAAVERAIEQGNGEQPGPPVAAPAGVAPAATPSAATPAPAPAPAAPPVAPPNPPTTPPSPPDGGAS